MELSTAIHIKTDRSVIGKIIAKSAIKEPDQRKAFEYAVFRLSLSRIHKQLRVVGSETVPLCSQRYPPTAAHSCTKIVRTL